MAENRSGGRIKDDLLTLQYLANKALQKTRTALVSFDILLSHKVWVVILGSLPVIMARFGLLSAGIRTDARCACIRPNGARDSIERLGMIYQKVPTPKSLGTVAAQRRVRLTAQWSRHRSLRSRLASPRPTAARMRLRRIRTLGVRLISRPAGRFSDNNFGGNHDNSSLHPLRFITSNECLFPYYTKVSTSNLHPAC